MRNRVSPSSPDKLSSRRIGEAVEACNVQSNIGRSCLRQRAWGLTNKKEKVLRKRFDSLQPHLRAPRALRQPLSKGSAGRHPPGSRNKKSQLSTGSTEVSFQLRPSQENAQGWFEPWVQDKICPKISQGKAGRLIHHR